MRQHYDFSKGKRGPVVPIPPGKTRITIRIDTEVLDWFRDRVDAAGGGSYQNNMNAALREHIRRTNEDLEARLRKILREELAKLPARAPRSR